MKCFFSVLFVFFIFTPPVFPSKDQTDNVFDDLDSYFSLRGTHQELETESIENLLIKENMMKIDDVIAYTKSVEEVGNEKIVQLSMKFAHILRHVLPQEDQSVDLANHIIANVISKDTINGLIVPILATMDASTITNQGYMAGMLNPIIHEINPALSKIFFDQYLLPRTIQQTDDVSKFSKFTDNVFCHTMGSNIMQKSSFELLNKMMRQLYPSFNQKVNKNEAINISNYIGGNHADSLEVIKNLRKTFIQQIRPTKCNGVTHLKNIYFNGFDLKSGYPHFSHHRKNITSHIGRSYLEINEKGRGVISGISKTELTFEDRQLGCNSSKWWGAIIAGGTSAVAVGRKVYEYTKNVYAAGTVGFVAGCLGGVAGWVHEETSNEHCLMIRKNKPNEKEQNFDKNNCLNNRQQDNAKQKMETYNHQDLTFDKNFEKKEKIDLYENKEKKIDKKDDKDKKIEEVNCKDPVSNRCNYDENNKKNDKEEKKDEVKDSKDDKKSSALLSSLDELDRCPKNKSEMVDNREDNVSDEILNDEAEEFLKEKENEVDVCGLSRWHLGVVMDDPEEYLNRHPEKLNFDEDLPVCGLGYGAKFHDNLNSINRFSHNVNVDSLDKCPELINYNFGSAF